MATITFISIYDRNANGLRLMSASLKRHGHQCHIIFLKRYEDRESRVIRTEPGEYPWIGIAKNGQPFKYAAKSSITDRELDLLCQTLVEIDPDVIGISVTTPLRSQATRVTHRIQQKLPTPVIWGGFDPTVNPHACLNLCDFVCVGEGDQTILDIAQAIDQGRSFEAVANLVYSRDEAVVTNARHPLVSDLDRCPWRDNTPQNKYLIDDDRLETNHPRLNDKPKGVYQTMSARGCPNHCSYCCEATLKEIYRGETFLRRRSPDDLLGELREVTKTFPVTMIHYEDEIFAINERWLGEFLPRYRLEINLPFTAYIYPTANIESILRQLKEAGLCNCCLALESGSERINRQVFRRVYNRELFLKTASLCKALRIDFYTDIITYNPYEMEQDLQDSLDVLTAIGGGFNMCINKLFVLPGTALATRMAEDGISLEQLGDERRFDYYCRLYWISSFNRLSAPVISLIQRFSLFRRQPQLVNPVLVELMINPLPALKYLILTSLPQPVHQAFQALKMSFRALIARLIPTTRD